MAQLKEAREYLRLRDASGRVVGFFLPVDPATAHVLFGVRSPYTREQVERRFREDAKGARPLSEFWDEMKKKYPEEFK
jgi:hypothetical protein